MDKAIIGGTGVYSVYEVKEIRNVQTKYGSVEVNIIDVEGEEIVFLLRHGKGHTTPPHSVNYRANMMALKNLGVKYIYGLVTSGSLDPNVREGSAVLIDDFIDFTVSRPQTFYDGDDNRVIHTDMYDPYCSNMRKVFMEQAKENKIDIVDNGVYVCFRGPRFETKSEIKMFRMLGGTLIGMTNVPEVVMAKELGMCYSAIGLISNMGCGMKEEYVSEVDFSGVIKQAKEDVLKTIFKVFTKKNLDQNNCGCNSATIEISKH